MEIYFFNDYYINIVQTIFFPRCRIRLLWERDRVGRYLATGGRKTFDMRGSIGTLGDAARPGQGREVTESKTVSCIGMPFIGYRWCNMYMNVFASGKMMSQTRHSSADFGGRRRREVGSVRVSFLSF